MLAASDCCAYCGWVSSEHRANPKFSRHHERFPAEIQKPAHLDFTFLKQQRVHPSVLGTGGST